MTKLISNHILKMTIRNLSNMSSPSILENSVDIAEINEIVQTSGGNTIANTTNYGLIVSPLMIESFANKNVFKSTASFPLYSQVVYDGSSYASRGSLSFSHDTERVYNPPVLKITDTLNNSVKIFSDGTVITDGSSGNTTIEGGTINTDTLSIGNSAITPGNTIQYPLLLEQTYVSGGIPQNGFGVGLKFRYNRGYNGSITPVDQGAIESFFKTGAGSGAPYAGLRFLATDDNSIKELFQVYHTAPNDDGVSTMEIGLNATGKLKVAAIEGSLLANMTLGANWKY
jgi:hypothetical protein